MTPCKKYFEILKDVQRMGNEWAKRFYQTEKSTAIPAPQEAETDGPK